MSYWQDMKNFDEQIPIKVGGFYVIKMYLVQLCCKQAHQGIGKNIGGNSYIGRYSKGKISADKICRFLANRIKYSNRTFSKWL